MTSAVAEKLLTAEEFGRLPDRADGLRQELVRGVVVAMPPPKPRHGYTCSAVNAALFTFVKAHRLGRVFGNDAGVVTETDPDTVRGPDVSYYSFERLPSIRTNDYPRVAPNLVVEVLSPSDEAAAVRRKVREYLTAGVSLVWLIDPEQRCVAVYRTEDRGVVLHGRETLTGDDVLPGFAIPVAELFDEEPDQ